MNQHGMGIGMACVIVSGLAGVGWVAVPDGSPEGPMDMLHTGTWGGVSQMTYPEGARQVALAEPVRIMGGLGMDWSEPILVPQPSLAVLAGLVMLVRRRRNAGRTRPTCALQAE